MAGLPVAFLVLAQAASASVPSYGPPAPPPASTANSKVEKTCVPQPAPDPASREIVVCALKPEGYRLPPDVVEARRLKKQGDAGRPHNPHEAYRDSSCSRVGPNGCITGPAINMVAVALTAAEISKRLAKGQEVGSIFETTPSTGDYQFYQEAKRRREEKEAQAAAKRAQAAAEAAQQQKPAADLTASAPTRQ